jgi:hypothetical protein
MHYYLNPKMRSYYKALFIMLILLAGSALSLLAGNEQRDPKNSQEFRISALKLDSSGKLNWMAFNQNGAIEFGVEQFLNERWVTVGMVAGDAITEQNPYSYSPHLHSGENKYRISWTGSDKTKNYSNVLVTVSKKEDVFFQISEDNQKVTFTGNTYYMLYNPYGFVTLRGYGNSLDISEFKPGMYCITYDNKVATFEKKPVWFSHSKHPIVRENKPEHQKKAKKPFEMSPP